MINKTLAAVATAAVLATGGAHATSLPAYNAASYDGIYDTVNAYSGHGLYLPGLLSNTSGTESTYWDQVSGEATLQNGSLTLTGSVKNQSNNSLTMDYTFQLTELTSHAGGPACGNSSTGPNSCNSNDPTDVDARTFIKFFNLDSAVITGTGSVLSGLELNATVFPLANAKPPQLGYGGNWLNMNFGYSNWFTYDANVTTIGGYNVKDPASNKWGGDLNLTFLGNNKELTTVPVPGALPLLGAGLMAFGLVARRRKS
ncbi:MAG: VPLPA-CTERM sorting domain-containing protein [Pseudomonadota bacterium]